jgi:hypothetical protein
MRRVSIHNGEYQVVSVGNGFAYEIIRNGDFASCILQGDDATAFRQRLDAAGNGDTVCADYDSVLGFAE